jgi:hypothetical protein
MNTFRVGLLLALLAGCAAPAIARPQVEIRNHTRWMDTDGNRIDCHEGGILRVADTFYWVGRSYKGNVDGIFGAEGAKFRCGFVCYSSTDLVHWKNRGSVLSYPSSGFLTRGTWHRPRMIFNAKTGKYVLWFFMFPDGTKSTFTMVVATADAPTGPFTVLTGEGFHVGGDLITFLDRDGRGYLCYEEGRKIRVQELTPDFLNLTGPVTVALQDGKPHEGSSLAYYKGRYLLAGSDVVGLNPSETVYAVADAPLGPYEYKGLMSEQKTWRSQICGFVYVAESDRLIAMCDQWLTGPDGNRASGEESALLWLPVHFDPRTGVARLEPVESWNPWEPER